MKIQELRQLTPKKLAKELAKARRDLAVAQFSVKTGKNQNVAQIKKLRRLVAQTLTLLSAPNKNVEETTSKTPKTK
jgi:ribosomal protein L29